MRIRSPQQAIMMNFIGRKNTIILAIQNLSISTYKINLKTRTFYCGGIIVSSRDVYENASRYGVKSRGIEKLATT